MRCVETYLLIEGGKGSKAYFNMFADLMSDNEQAKQLIGRYVSWAHKTLKKNDRIVWFLRWVRVELAGRLKDSNVELERLNRRLGTNFSRADVVPLNTLMTDLTHYMSMSIPQIETVPWGKQSPNELLNQLSDIEEDWQEANRSSGSLINYQEGEEPEKIIEFPDGYAWFDLHTYYCPAEAQAMGHCGNQGGNRSSTILSLRRLAKQGGGQTYWYPVATFIRDDDGYLGEMKGRENEKPIEKYHPYIVALLKHDYIEGIRGGGYLPSHNFKMSDLDPDTREELLAQKPELAEVGDLYEREGMTHRVRRMIDQHLPRGLDIGTYVPDKKEFIVQQWTDFEQFLRDIDDQEGQKILEIALGEADFQADRGKTPEEAFVRTIQDMPLQWQERMVARAGIFGSPNERVCAEAAHKLIASDDQYFQVFEEVYHDQEALQDEAWERLGEYADAGWPFVGRAYTNLPSGDQIKDFVLQKTEVRLTVSERDMVEFAMADPNREDADDVDYDVMRMQGDSGYGDASWDTIDNEYLPERRREEGLYNRRGEDEWLKGKDDDEEGSMVDDYINALQGNKQGGRISDTRQHELKLEAARLTRLLALSGIA